MRRWAAPFFPLLREPFGLAAVVVALAMTLGCFGAARERDQYRDESARRATRIEKLEASNAALSEERLVLIDEIEDLRQLGEELEGKVEVLEQARGELETTLRETRSELARHTEEVQQLRQTYGGLVADLESEVAAGRIEIDRLREGLILNLPQEILFGSGSAQLSERGRAVVGKLAGRLATGSHRIEVRGHTDNVAIQGALAERYPSNWELAGARAASVVRLLAERGVPPDRMSAVSFGEFQTVASNDTPEGRARNRRIEIRLLPDERLAPAANPAASE
jgi:chemotaxis protein MotB